jgi:hypothetical protein
MYWNIAFSIDSIIVKNISSLARGTSYLNKVDNNVLARDNTNEDYVTIGHRVPVSIIPESENKELLPPGCPKRAEQPAGEYIKLRNFIDIDELVLQPVTWLPFIHISTDRSFEELYEGRDTVIWIATVDWNRTSEFVRNGLKVLPFTEGKIKVTVIEPSGKVLYSYIKDTSLVPSNNGIIAVSDDIKGLPAGEHIVDLKLMLSHVNIGLYQLNSRCKIKIVNP